MQIHLFLTRSSTQQVPQLCIHGIVLGLAPADGESWQRLDELYLALEEAVPLGYGMTPHITIAYFRPGILHPQQLLQLKKALKPVEWDDTLEMEKLVYQEFTGMNHYWNG